MLQADKQVLLAGVKQNALQLRQKELDFNVERYTNLATQASVVAGFSFESLVELEVPEDTHWLLSSAYFVFGSAAMAISLYCLCIASFACVFSHRLALQGPHGSLERAVEILVDNRVHLFSMAGIALMCLVLTAVLMAWIKMGYAAFVVSIIFVLFAYAVIYRMNALFHLFNIEEGEVVTGAVHVNNAASNEAVDLSKLTAVSRKANSPAGSSSASSYMAQAYQPLTDDEAAAAEGSCSVTIAGRSSAPAPRTSALFSFFGSSQTAPSRPQASAPASEDLPSGEVTVHHEGHLFKKGNYGWIATEAVSRRRYFVLHGSLLYYFRAWEDYGSTGIAAAVNKATPIDVTAYEPMLLAPEEGANRFDLVPKNDPAARKWELQAASMADCLDWIGALRQASHAAAGLPGSSSDAQQGIGAPTVRHQA